MVSPMVSSFKVLFLDDPEELKKSIGHKDHTPETLY